MFHRRWISENINSCSRTTRCSMFFHSGNIIIDSFFRPLHHFENFCGLFPLHCRSGVIKRLLNRSRQNRTLTESCSEAKIKMHHDSVLSLFSSFSMAVSVYINFSMKPVFFKLYSLDQLIVCKLAATLSAWQPRCSRRTWYTYWCFASCCKYILLHVSRCCCACWTI